MLSEAERRELASMERRLAAEEPKFNQYMASGGIPRFLARIEEGRDWFFIQDCLGCLLLPRSVWQWVKAVVTLSVFWTLMLVITVLSVSAFWRP